MEKPTPVRKEVFDFMSMASFIEEKYNLTLFDSENRKDLWHWVVGTFEIDNGAPFYLSAKYYSEDGKTEPWVRDTMKLFAAEFGNEIYTVCEW